MLLLLTSGCGGGGLPAGETGTVSGTVTYNGKPVPEGCGVMFLPVSGEAGVMGIGTTDSSGAYTLKMRNEENILAGKYTVGISPPNSDNGSDDPDSAANVSEETSEPKLPFPEKYLSPETSEVTFDVVAGSNSFNIEMKD